MDKVFIDVNIPMYAAGREHPLRSPCQNIIHQIAETHLEAFTDAEIFQEILYRFSSIKKLNLGLKIYDHFRSLMSNRILALGEEEIILAAKLIKRYQMIKPRDIIHASVMLTHDIHIIYSADKEFDLIKEITRVDPMAVKGSPS